METHAKFPRNRAPNHLFFRRYSRSRRWRVRRIMQLVAVSALICASSFGGAAAQDAPPPYPEFTFKRVKPPAPGTSKRITVQITPMPETVPDAVLPDLAPAADAGRYDWFWAAISPALEQSGPGRLDDAIAALSGDTPDQWRGNRRPRMLSLRGGDPRRWPQGHSGLDGRFWLRTQLHHRPDLRHQLE